MDTPQDMKLKYVVIDSEVWAHTMTGWLKTAEEINQVIKTFTFLGGPNSKIPLQQCISIFTTLKEFQDGKCFVKGQSYNIYFLLNNKIFK